LEVFRKKGKGRGKNPRKKREKKKKGRGEERTNGLMLKGKGRKKKKRKRPRSFYFPPSDLLVEVEREKKKGEGQALNPKKKGEGGTAQMSVAASSFSVGRKEKRKRVVTLRDEQEKGEKRKGGPASFTLVPSGPVGRGIGKREREGRSRRKGEGGGSIFPAFCPVLPFFGRGEKKGAQGPPRGRKKKGGWKACIPPLATLRRRLRKKEKRCPGPGKL